MAEGRSATGADAASESERDRARSRVSDRPPLAIVLLLIAALAILALALRSYYSTPLGGDENWRRVEILAEKRPVPGLISVWAEPGMDIDFALSRAGVRCEKKTRLGESYYVLCVEAGEENSAVTAMRRVRGVYDAGRVYEEPDPTIRPWDVEKAPATP